MFMHLVLSNVIYGLFELDLKSLNVHLKKKSIGLVKEIESVFKIPKSLKIVKNHFDKNIF
jgi:hypothetical protein